MYILTHDLNLIGISKTIPRLMEGLLSYVRSPVSPNGWAQYRVYKREIDDYHHEGALYHLRLLRTTVSDSKIVGMDTLVLTTGQSIIPLRPVNPDQWRSKIVTILGDKEVELDSMTPVLVFDTHVHRDARRLISPELWGTWRR